MLNFVFGTVNEVSFSAETQTTRDMAEEVSFLADYEL